MDRKQTVLIPGFGTRHNLPILLFPENLIEDENPWNPPSRRENVLPAGATGSPGKHPTTRTSPHQKLPLLDPFPANSGWNPRARCLALWLFRYIGNPGGNRTDDLPALRPEIPIENRLDECW